MPLRHKDTKISQRFKYQHYKLSEAFEPLWLSRQVSDFLRGIHFSKLLLEPEIQFIIIKPWYLGVNSLGYQFGR